MQKIIIFFILFTTVTPCTQAQKDTLHYYVDYYEKPADPEKAIYHIRVYKEKPGDIYWKRDMYGHFENNLISSGTTKDPLGETRHGNFLFYYIDGAKNESGRYDNGKKEGEWTQWYDDGKVLAVYHYKNGKMTGTNVSWHENGKALDSFILDQAGNGMGYGFYASGVKKYEGNFVAGVKSGKWTYYYDVPRYHRSMEVNFEADSLIGSKCFDLNGEPQDLCIYEREATFKGGNESWVGYLVRELGDSDYAKHMKKSRTIYEVIVRFMVNKDGTVSDAKVENRGIKKLDKIAEHIIMNSPVWQPAIQYNQKVNAYRRQPLTFTVED
ncbi:MAG: energy transducer TonB [Ferruginibacter sp.]